MSTAGPSRRLVAWLGLVVLIMYVLWIGGPYLRSIVVRDAAVTSWIHVAASPIDGVVSRPLRIGERVRADGRILSVENPRADPIPLARARGELDRARERGVSLTRIVREMEALASTRAARAAQYAALFKRNLDVKIGGMTEYVGLTKKRIELERIEANRRARLMAEGRETPSAADAAAARVADLERQEIDVQTGLSRALQHRRAADAGLFFLDDGSDGAAEQRSLEDARVGLDRARADSPTHRDVESAQHVAGATQRLFDRSHAADVTRAPGSMAWVESSSAPTRGPIRASPRGSTAEMLVNARARRPCRPARRLARGGRLEENAALGQVLLMRGAAATLGQADLAAVAKGRHAGVGQVLITLEATAADAEACSIGRAAFVYFPDATVLDIVRARLRW